MSEHRIVNPASFPRPRGYVNGIVAEGRTLYVAGQIGWDGAGKIVSDDLGVQFIQALDNVLTVVREGGAKPEHIVKLLVMVTDLDKYRAAAPAIGEGWRARLGKYYPAMSLVKVAGLLEPGAMVEIEAVVVIPAQES